MLKKLLRVYRQHSLKDLPGLIVKNIRYAFKHRSDPKVVSEFDSASEVETDSIRETGSLDIDSPNVRHAVRYEPSPASAVKAILAKLDLEWPKFTFVDLGSGKGRVLLLAAELPFKNIIGVEFSPELVDLSKKNIANYRGPADLGQRISCLCQDAVEFVFPQQPLVCYFYNPFAQQVLEKVVANLLSRHAGLGHEIYIIYLNPAHRGVFEREGQAFIPIFEENEAVVYRCNSLAAQ